MGRRIKVQPVKLPGGYVLRWTDPESNKPRQRTAKTKRKREAYAAAAELEIKLNSGESECGEVTWMRFRMVYEQEKISTLAVASQSIWKTTANWTESTVNPVLLSDFTARKVSTFAARLRGNGLEETSIASYLRQLRAAFGWAVKRGYLSRAPAIEMPKIRTSSRMKGRPITLEEFERMLAKISQVVDDRSSWELLLRGLWYSGLRIDEAMNLSWDDQQRLCIASIDSRRPLMQIPIERDKGAKHRLLPITPDFVELLRSQPFDSRHGFVFRPLLARGECRRTDTIGRKICAIGEAANVVVHRGRSKIKYASAHDLRRSFGERWAMRVMPPVLMELMRHETIETTMQFYVGRNAERTADAVWRAFSDDSGDISEKPDTSPESVDDVS